jgi:hypothetical protein
LGADPGFRIGRPGRVPLLPSCLNEKIEADTRAYALKAVMQVYEGLNPETLKSLANAGLDSGRLMALAFQGIADRAEKIGNLNITPDLLNTIIRSQNSFEE